MEVYFLQSARDRSAPIKIGRTAYGVDKRRRDLQTSHWEDLACLGSLKTEKETEKELHRRFSDYHIRREWFYPGPSLAQFIKDQFNVDVVPNLALPEIAAPQPSRKGSEQRPSRINQALDDLRGFFWPHKFLADEAELFNWSFDFAHGLDDGSCSCEEENEEDRLDYGDCDCPLCSAEEAYCDIENAPGFIGLCSRSGLNSFVFFRPTSQHDVRLLIQHLMLAREGLDWLSERFEFLIYKEPRVGRCGFAERFIRINTTSLFAKFCRNLDRNVDNFSSQMKPSHD